MNSLNSNTYIYIYIFFFFFCVEGQIWYFKSLIIKTFESSTCDIFIIRDFLKFKFHFSNNSKTLIAVKH